VVGRWEDVMGRWQSPLGVVGSGLLRQLLLLAVGVWGGRRRTGDRGGGGSTGAPPPLVRSAAGSAGGGSDGEVGVGGEGTALASGWPRRLGEQWQWRRRRGRENGQEALNQGVEVADGEGGASGLGAAAAGVARRRCFWQCCGLGLHGLVV
jgi:hypothetical protein